MECHRTRSYAGHRDGVWEVSCARHTPTMIGTASAGKLFPLNNGSLNVPRSEAEKDAHNL